MHTWLLTVFDYAAEVNYSGVYRRLSGTSWARSISLESSNSLNKALRLHSGAHSPQGLGAIDQMRALCRFPASGTAPTCSTATAKSTPTASQGSPPPLPLREVHSHCPSESLTMGVFVPHVFQSLGALFLSHCFTDTKVDNLISNHGVILVLDHKMRVLEEQVTRCTLTIPNQLKIPSGELSIV